MYVYSDFLFSPQKYTSHITLITNQSFIMGNTLHYFVPVLNIVKWLIDIESKERELTPDHEFLHAFQQ